MGLDYGDARVGVAVSDSLGWTARGIKTISRKNPIDLSSTVAEIVELVKNLEVSKIVLGYPKHMNNTEGENCFKVLAFESKLKAAIPDVIIEKFDERLTTARANQIFDETGLSKSKHKQNVDKMAASIILQDYLSMIESERKISEISINKENKMDNNNNNFNFDENDSFDGDMEDDSLETIVLTDDDGNEMEYAIIDEFVHETNNYLIVIRAEDAEEDEAEAAIFKQVGSDDEENVYEEISEDEYNALEDVLKERMAEFDIDIQ